MKRIIPAVLSAVLLFILSIPAAAEDVVLPRAPSYAPEMSMAQYHELFEEAEQRGLSAPLTRAAAATIFAKLDGVDLSGYSSAGLSDVDGNASFAAAAAWAVASNIFSADGGFFLPAAELNRESFSIAVKAWLDHGGKTLTVRNDPVAIYDAGYMTEIGREAAALMQQGGIILVGADGMFSPLATVTVAEAETFFLRLIGAVTDIFPMLPVSTVRESAPVDNSWFDDACFIGHSLVVGMEEYFDLNNADYYAVIGHTAQDVLDFPYYTMPTGRMGSLKNSMENGSYGKVYIMLGINDCSDREDRIDEFKEPMRKILQIVKDAQPEATIYIISVEPVGRATRNNLIYNPENTILYSQALKDLSREFGAEYIDIFRFLADSEGYMREEFDAGDGIHIKGNQYPLIEEFLKCHT